MKSLRELFGDCKSWPEVAKKAKNRLIESGYIYNEVFGWEKPLTIESFQLDPNMTAIPSETIFDKDLNHNCKGPSKQWLKYQEYKDNLSKSEYAEYKNNQRLENSEMY